MKKQIPSIQIPNISRAYLNAGELDLEVLGRGHTWIDTGTHESLLEASQFVRTIEQHQGFKVACLEEISWHKGWLSPEDLLKSTEALGKTSYAEYLRSLNHK